MVIIVHYTQIIWYISYIIPEKWLLKIDAFRWIFLYQLQIIKSVSFFMISVAFCHYLNKIIIKPQILRPQAILSYWKSNPGPKLWSIQSLICIVRQADTHSGVFDSHTNTHTLCVWTLKKPLSITASTNVQVLTIRYFSSSSI